MQLNELAPVAGSKKIPHNNRRGSKTCGKGHKGQNARSGGGVRVGFEGGQQPLYRRLPKYGFNNVFAKKYVSINLERLADFKEKDVITPDVLLEKGIISKIGDGVVLLSRGEISKPYTFKFFVRISKVAAEKIKAAGGTIEE